MEGYIVSFVVFSLIVLFDWFVNVRASDVGHE